MPSSPWLLEYLESPFYNALGEAACKGAPLMLLCLRTHTQAHSQTVRIVNTTKASVEGDVKASSSDRYTITPSSFRLKPGEAAELSISLRLEPKFAQRRKAIDSGQRDAIFIKVCWVR